MIFRAASGELGQQYCLTRQRPRGHAIESDHRVNQLAIGQRS
jgi:hypothetical protein